MQEFLKLVAQDLYLKYRNNMSRIALVFPNKRAGLFFSEYLSQLDDNPIWAPRYISISDLFQELSSEQIGDPIKLICELYEIVKEEIDGTDTLDEFYLWGELLISDFDDIDKNLVPTDKLFTNLKELKSILPQIDYLDEEQLAALKEFFRNLSIEKETVLKEKFLAIWNRLEAIYNKFKDKLTEQNLAYEGMLYRNVIENLDCKQLEYDKYVFVGFNVLNKVETKFFKTIQDCNKALFYWDYDHFYLDNLSHEAGEFIRRNLKLFPSELKDKKHFNNFKEKKQITYISSATENGQARYVKNWINTHHSINEKENAVVLCNESLLLPTLHSIPKKVKNINITMGFPLAQTPIFSFIQALLDLQINGYNFSKQHFLFDEVITVLQHPYAKLLSAESCKLEHYLSEKHIFYPKQELLSKDKETSLLFSPQPSLVELSNYLIHIINKVAQCLNENAHNEETKKEYRSDTFNQLFEESLFRAYTIVNRLKGLIENENLAIQKTTYRLLLNKILQNTNIPFHGEPAVGLQVLGVLETRNLDFKNIILLSLNEGQLPKGSNSASYVPYNLRKAFGMTTLEHKNAVYAYYFYRMIQRAENITLVYNTASDGINKGEQSRFMLQLLTEWNQPIQKLYLQAGQSPEKDEPIVIQKDNVILDRLHRLYNLNASEKASTLSPSALNCYLDCRLKFYYKYIAHLNVPEEINSEIDPPTFGTIFHQTAEDIYHDLTQQNKLITKDRLEELLKDDLTINRYIDQSFKKHFFRCKPDDKVDYNGIQLINAKVLVTYIKQLLKLDMSYAPFSFLGAEQHIKEIFNIKLKDELKLKINVGGIIDRIDSKDGVRRIVDYKTNGDKSSVKSIASLFTPSKDRNNYAFQAFLYSSIMCDQTNDQIAPAILYINKASRNNYSPVITIGERKEKQTVNNFSRFDDLFRGELTLLIQEIFDKETPFVQTEIEEKCSYCDFKEICRRK